MMMNRLLLVGRILKTLFTTSPFEATDIIVEERSVDGKICPEHGMDGTCTSCLFERIRELEDGVTGVFARSDHPQGYGMVRQGEIYGRAHGYSVIYVRCADEAELAEVAKRLSLWNKPFHGLQVHGYGNGQMGEWYGGLFDLIAIIPGHALKIASWQSKPDEEQRFRSLGDNRFTGIYTAEEVLQDDPVSPQEGV